MQSDIQPESSKRRIPRLFFVLVLVGLACLLRFLYWEAYPIRDFGFVMGVAAVGVLLIGTETKPTGSAPNLCG